MYHAMQNVADATTPQWVINTKGRGEEVTTYVPQLHVATIPATHNLEIHVIVNLFSLEVGNDKSILLEK